MNEVLDHPFWGKAKVGNHVVTPCRGWNLCKKGVVIFEKIDLFIEGVVFSVWKCQKRF